MVFSIAEGDGMSEYTKRHQEESKAELRAAITELMAWHARGRRKLMRFAIAKWAGLLLLLASAIWVIA